MIELQGQISNASKVLNGSIFAVPGGTGGGGELQEKTITPTTEDQTVTPDSGYFGLSSVIVNAAQLQEKTVTPTTEQQIVTTDDGYYGLSSVTVEAMAVEILPDAEGVAF